MSHEPVSPPSRARRRHRRPWRWSLRRRLVISAALATAAVAVLLAVTMVGAAGFLLRRQVDQELRDRADQLGGELGASPIVLGGPTTELSVADLPALGGRSADGPVLSRVIDSIGRVEVGSTLQTLPVDDADRAVAAGSLAEHFDDVVTPSAHYRTFTVPVPDLATAVGDTTSTAPELAVQVAKPVGDIDRALLVLAIVGVVATFGGLVAAALLAWWVARAAIRPVEGFASTIEHVAATGDLSVTVPTDGASELRRLAGSFNGLMASLATSRARQQQLIADAGHELRTPLTSIRTNLELLVEADDAIPPPERRELLGEVTAQFEELSSLVADVVALARDDADADAPTEIRLDRVVERAVERARRRAGPVRIVATTTPTVRDAQATLVERAVLNVLDNALKWSPPDGVVTVRQDGGVIEVDDEGPGIAPEHRAQAFERFWRAPTARAVPGSGLGLAIVAQVMANHHGVASIDDSPVGGTRVRLWFPDTTRPAATDPSGDDRAFGATEGPPTTAAGPTTAHRPG